MRPSNGASTTEHEILTLIEVSRMLHACPSTVRKMIRNGKIPSFRVGRDWRFRRDQIERWIAEQ
jgi:excisionase family DNA binding protein